MKFYISTFGCRANQADSAVLRDDLRRHSLQESDSHLHADLVIVNSCTVTHSADQDVQQFIRKVHRENPRAKIVVMGCYAERDPESLSRIEGVRYVVGNKEKPDLVQILENDIKNDGTYCGPVRIHHGDLSQEKQLRLAPFMDIGAKTRPFLKIQDGCDARCSYCIIPFVRGVGRSAEPDDIIKQVEALVDAGYKEIVLTGIHLGTYGWKLESTTTLAGLIRRILQETKLERLRIGSVEPMRFSSELIDLAVESSRIAPHFHLPLQSGSNKILRMMRRPYTIKRYAGIVNTIREKLPNAAIGTDVIVGFPGETEEDYLQTYDFIKSSPLTYLHVFSYSPREGTSAADFANQIDVPTIKRRSQQLRQLSFEKNSEFRRSFLGRTLSVLTLSEEQGETGEPYLSGLSDNYLKVKLARDGLRPNDIIDARVTAMENGSLIAKKA